MPKLICLFVLILAAALVLAPVVQAQDQPTKPTEPPAQAPPAQEQPANPPQAQAPAKDTVLKFKVTYKGADGPVDETHKILIFVFDQPEIAGGVMPVAFGTVSENGGTASFTLYANPVYIAVAYDKPGNYDFTGPPASGSPVALYTKEPPAAAPIALTQGETTEVSMEFDDTGRMP